MAGSGGREVGSDGGTGLPPERQVRVAVRPSDEAQVAGFNGVERGAHVLVFAEPEEASPHAEGLRRYVLVTKSGKFASRTAEDFHWVAAYPPCCSSDGRTVVVVRIENGMWSFASGAACVTYGLLPPGEADPVLPSWAPEFECVTFATRLAEPGEVDSVSFDPESNKVPPEARQAYNVFYKAYADIDGDAVSTNDRKDMYNPSVGLTYGEVHFEPTYKLLKQIGIKDDDVLVDLGSGTGRVVLAAALAFPGLRRCVGVELLHGLHEAAVLAQRRILADCAALEAQHAPVELVEADFLTVDWMDATVVVAMSLCYPERVVDDLDRQALQLGAGAIYITMHAYLHDDACSRDAGRWFEPVKMREAAPQHSFDMEMSYGFAPLFVYRRVDGGPMCLDEMD
eukprot:TRINITY_DN51221_c0_g1_i2.p1 TRINITY_DN51221_c0_g1~~TRINITY_DN51221_c0_g1_i2.p1  ORF type:complete len:397 (+),score=90.41 TRINITY_DN51221_c0_g1_i2:148-1338(+)